ncbi:MAG: hypothetical protein HY226_02985 [Candidatus Vogelbacteria bacterium]|nr:hypothetical protein [Candidatus Vogelbacteria bacterium]
MNFSTRDLFWGTVICTFMIANGIILKEKCAEVKVLRQDNQKLAADVATLSQDVHMLYKHSGQDYADIKGLRQDVANLNGDSQLLKNRVDRLDNYSSDDFSNLGSLSHQVSDLRDENSALRRENGGILNLAAENYFSICSLRGQVSKLTDQQNIESLTVQGDIADLKKELNVCEEFVMNAAMSLHDDFDEYVSYDHQIKDATVDILDSMQATIDKNAAFTSAALNDTNLTCSKLSPGHLGNLYSSDSDGHIFVLGECNGKGWDKDKDKVVDSSLDLKLDPQTARDIEAIKADVQGASNPNSPPLLLCL